MRAISSDRAYAREQNAIREDAWVYDTHRIIVGQITEVGSNDILVQAEDGTKYRIPRSHFIVGISGYVNLDLSLDTIRSSVADFRVQVP